MVTNLPPPVPGKIIWRLEFMGDYYGVNMTFVLCFILIMDVRKRF